MRILKKRAPRIIALALAGVSVSVVAALLGQAVIPAQSGAASGRLSDPGPRREIRHAAGHPAGHALNFDD